MRSAGRSRLPLAIVVAVAAAGAATFLLRPRTGLIEPAAVDVQGYFTAFQLDRAEELPQRPAPARGRAGWSWAPGTLALLAWRPPRRVFDRLARRPILGGAAAGAGHLAAARAGRAAAVRLAPRARGRRGAGHAGLGRLARRRGQVGRHRRGVRGGRRSAGARAGAPLPAQLVGARGGRDRRLRRGHDLALPGRDRPDLQRLRAAAPGRHPLRRARAGRARRRGRGGGLPGRREPPHHGCQRLRRRARPLQAGGALRQPDLGLPARRDPHGRGARARPPEAQRPDPRPGLARAGRARGHVPGPAAGGGVRAARGPRRPAASSPARSCCPRSRWRSRW